jgi:hypothetical protein
MKKQYKTTHKYDYRHQSSSKSRSHALWRKKHSCELRLITTQVIKNEHYSHELGDSPLYHKVSHTHFFKDSVATNANLSNYDDLINLRKHIQNIINIIELVIQKSGGTCKISLYARIWYHILEPNSILGLHDLYVGLIFYFNTSIPVKKNTTKLFIINK